MTASIYKAIAGVWTLPPVTPFGAPSVPSVPRSLVATTPGTTSSRTAQVSWLPPASTSGASVTGYTITLTGGTHGALPVLDGSDTSAVLIGLVDSTIYTFTIAAVNAVGTGPAATTTFTSDSAAGGTLRFPGDPGLGYMFYGANNGDMNITAADVTVFGAGGNTFNCVREYHSASSSEFGTTSGERTNITTWANTDNRMVFFSFKENPWTVAQIASVGAGTATSALTSSVNSGIDSAANFFKGLTRSIVLTFHHEPDDADFPDATSQGDYRAAFRYIIARFKSNGVTNVAWASPFFVGDRFGTAKTNTWHKWHPNWGGVLLSSGKPRWDYNVVHLDGIDNYNPKLGQTLTATSRNDTWTHHCADFLSERINGGARQLPWIIGEWGMYTLPATLDDSGITIPQIISDSITIGVKTQNFVGFAIWNQSLALMDDTNDPGRVKRNGLRDAINGLLPVSGVTIP